MKNKENRTLNLILTVLPLALIVLIWAKSAQVIDNKYILPSVKSTVEEFVLLFNNSEFYLSFFFTFLRSFTAFAISFAISFILAIITAKIRYVRSAVMPIISVMRSLPTIAVVLLLYFWTTAKIAPVIVTMLVVLPTLFTHIDGAISSLDKTVSEAGRVDGANEINVLIKIELPMILDNILIAIGSGIALSFKLMVAAEVIAQTPEALGFMLNSAKVYFQTAKMIAIVVCAVVFGVITEFVFDKFAKKAGNWK